MGRLGMLWGYCITSIKQTGCTHWVPPYGGTACWGGEFPKSIVAPRAYHVWRKYRHIWHRCKTSIMCLFGFKVTILREDIIIYMVYLFILSVYRGFRLLWLPVIITLLFLLDGPTALAGVSDDSTNMSKRDISTRKYEQTEQRL